MKINTSTENKSIICFCLGFSSLYINVENFNNLNIFILLSYFTILAIISLYSCNSIKLLKEPEKIKFSDFFSSNSSLIKPYSWFLAFGFWISYLFQNIAFFDKFGIVFIIICFINQVSLLFAFSYYKITQLNKKQNIS